MKKYILIIICLFVANKGFSQKVWKADLPIVERSDYYNIELSQELIGAGLKSLKILDEKEVEVPYFIRSVDPIQEIDNFEAFGLKSNQTNLDKNTRFISESHKRIVYFI